MSPVPALKKRPLLIVLAVLLLVDLVGIQVLLSRDGTADKALARRISRPHARGPGGGPTAVRGDHRHAQPGRRGLAAVDLGAFAADSGRLAAADPG